MSILVNVALLGSVSTLYLWKVRFAVLRRCAGVIRYPSARSGGVGAGMRSVGSLWRRSLRWQGIWCVREGRCSRR